MSSHSTVLDPLRAGPASSTSLVQALRLPQPAVSRTLAALQRDGRVLKMGTTRSTRYALPRSVPGAGTSWPVFQVDTAGKVRALGRLYALMPSHFHFETACQPLRGWCAGLPWYLRDLVPDEQRLAWCIHHGWDGPGDLIVGVEALDLHRRPPRRALSATQRAVEYPRLAQEVAATPGSCSQLGGAQPKFTVLMDHGGHVVQALVKFSPSLDTPAGRRWADLLIAEHLALAHLNSRGASAAHSRMFRFDDRIFLEVDRFDRVGAQGRRGVISLRALAITPGGAEESWSTTAARLAGSRALPKNDARQIRLLEAFSCLIAHARRHAGDLALFDHHDGHFALAPAFDVSPSLFAPQGDSIPQARFEVPGPAQELLDVWPHARRLADSYWELLVAEPLLSEEFRALCAQSLAALRAVPVCLAPAQ